MSDGSALGVRLAQVVDGGSRPRVGDTVRVLSASDSSTRPYVGQTGKLVQVRAITSDCH